MKRLILTISILAATFAQADLPAEVSLAQTAGFEGAHVQRYYGPEELPFLAGARSTAFGNIDGDAYDDLIIGVPEYNGNAGAVYVIYGDAGYPAFEYSLGLLPSDIRMTIINGQPGDRVGYAVAAADVDSDGFDDVVIGAPGANVPNVQNAGACVVVYGSAEMPGSPEGTGTNLYPDIDNPTVPDTLTIYYGIDPGDLCGSAVAAGDMTNNGLADVVVGAPNANVSNKAGAGEAYLFQSAVSRRGKGLNAAGNPSIDKWYKIYGGSVSALLGTALAVGDVNGDGFGDLAIGAPGVGGGRVYVLSGSGDPVGFLLIDFAAFGFGEINGTGNDDLFGSSIAIGNFDGDKAQDILIGAPKADITPEDNLGGVFLVLGGDSLVTDAVINLANTPGTYGDSRIIGAAENTGLGKTVALGDVNGDGLDDIIYGQTTTDSTSGTAVGSVSVHFAGSVASFVDLSTDSPHVIIYGGTADDAFGAAVASFGDLDNDGRSDLSGISNNGISPFGIAGNKAGYTAAIYGEGTPDTAFIQHGFPGGDTPTIGVGGGHLSPTFRLWAKFNAGTANYLQVELKRTPLDLTNLGPSSKEYWILSTPKTGWTQADLIFQWTDDQLEGISSSQIKFAQAPAAEGPWTDLNPVIDFDKRTLSVSVAELGYFAIYTNLPVISLIGESELFHECGDVYMDAGATAADAEDGDLTANIEVTGSVDDQNPGIYPIAYNVMDSNNNVAQTVVRTVTVRDLTAPQLVRTGAANVFTQCGLPYNDLGAVATDSCDGALAVDVDASAVLINTPGSYQVIYSATDDTGNNSQVTRTVDVVDTNGPVITLTSGNLTLDCNEPYLEPGYSASDSCEGDVTSSVVASITNLNGNVVVGSIDSSAAGSFRIDYNVMDAQANAAATVSRTVTVLDNCDLTELLCTTNLDGAQQVPSTNSSATGTATWTKVGADKVVLNFTHNVVNPTMAHIHTGAPGFNGGVVLDFGNPASPIIRVLTVADYNTYANTPHYLNVHSQGFNSGEIRGDIDCTAINGQDGFQSADQNGDFVISLSELLRVIQFYNSLGYHCADDPGSTEDGFEPGPGANQSCQPYDTDYNPQDWTISLTELLRVIQFYNSLGYHYCPGEGTEDDFCPGL